MKRGVAALIAAVWMIAAVSGCASAPRAMQPANSEPAPGNRFSPPPALSSSPEAPPQTPPPTPVTQKTGPITATWYTERNAQIRKAIKHFEPWYNAGQIDEAIESMRIDPDKPMVALTFDDGPVPGVTDKILDILEQYHARATFFVCGWRFQDPRVRSIASRAVTLGCEIGNHTQEHDVMDRQNIVDKRYAVTETNKVVFDATGYVVRSLRPPGGIMGTGVGRVAKENGMAIVLWSQSGNVNEYDPEKIAQNVQKQEVNGRELQDGDIILLHDTKEHMVDAVKIIVPQLLDEGYQLVTAWELLNCSEEGFVPGDIYKHQ